MSQTEEGQKWGVQDKRTSWERQQQPSKMRRNWRDFSGVTVCIAASVMCLGVCIVVLVRTSELQSRIVSLEQQRDAQLSPWMLSLEQVELIILGRLDQILDEVSVVHQQTSIKVLRTTVIGLLLFTRCCLPVNTYSSETKA